MWTTGIRFRESLLPTLAYTVPSPLTALLSTGALHNAYSNVPLVDKTVLPE